MDYSVHTMQQLRVHRACVLGAGLSVYMLVCAIATVLGYIDLSIAQFTILIAIGVVGFVAFLTMIYLELNLSLNDPDLSLIQMIWAIVLVVGCAWFATELKPLFILTGLSLVLIGTSRLEGRNLWIFVLFGISLYLSLLAIEYFRHTRQILWLSEIITCTAYSLIIALGPMLFRLEKSVLQDELEDQNQQLTEAFNQINRLAIKDELTGSCNRRHLGNVLAQQKAMADRRDYVFSICILDLDHFRNVNDFFGHHTGDMVLKDFARIAESIVREVDCVARSGGEEFVIMLAGTSEQDALVVASRIRAMLCELQIHPGRPEYRITSSVGVTQYRKKEEIRDMMERAEYCLYKAKRNGRDKVNVAEPDFSTSVAV